MNSFNIPAAITEIVSKLKEHGFSTWVVGGAIRNYFLHRHITDWDLSTQATPGEMMQIFPYANASGADFGCVLLPSEIGTIQITTLREESAYKDHRRPHHIVFTKDIVKDLMRRDFTCNAIAFDMIKQRWIDPLGGQKDIQNQLIRAVRNPQLRLQEDALRILRAIRFVSELGFSLAPDLKTAMVQSSQDIAYLSKERIYAEWKRIVSGEHVEVALQILRDIRLTDLLPVQIPAIVDVKNVVPIFWLRMVALFAHDFSKLLESSPRNWIDFGVPKKYWHWIRAMSELLYIPPPLSDEQRYAWVSWARTIDDQKAMIHTTAVLGRTDIEEYLKHFYQLYPDLDFHRLPMTTTEMLHLAGIKKGPKAGQFLQSLYQWVANQPSKVTPAQIEKWIKARYTYRV
ncbi:MAG: hypothetical protein KDK51_02255 [Deltaproteobacteria bacterium]|nr:hypothetical protein [Deltaproteobacteria bacterium]